MQTHLSRPGKTVGVGSVKIGNSWEFPGSPVVKTPCFHCRGLGSIPGQVPASGMAWPGKKKKGRKQSQTLGSKSPLSLTPTDGKSSQSQ